MEQEQGKEQQFGFTNEERKIFSIRVNGKSRHFDPLPIYWKMVDDTDLEGDIKVAGMETELPEVQREAHAAAQKIIEWTRKVFDLPQIDRDTGAGVTDVDVTDIFFEWLDFIGVKKNEAEEPPTLLPSTEQASSAAG